MGELTLRDRAVLGLVRCMPGKSMDELQQAARVLPRGAVESRLPRLMLFGLVHRGRNKDGELRWLYWPDYPPEPKVEAQCPHCWRTY